MLTLKKLELERQDFSFRPDYGKVTGKAVFDGEGGEVQLKLTPELCHRILLPCADAIVGVAKEAATSLVLEAQASIAQDAAPAAIGGAA